MTQLWAPFRCLVLIALAIPACVPWAATGSTSYEMSLEVDARRGTFHGAVTVVYRNPAPVDIAEIFFRLYANDADLYGSASLEVEAAHVANELVEAVLFAGDTVLMLPLAVPLAPADQVEMRLTFRGRAADTLGGFATSTEYGVLSRSRDILTLTAFYPIVAPYTEEGWAIDPPAAFGDPLFADAATYEVSVVVEQDVTVIPVADTSSAEADGRVRFTYSRTGMRDFPLAFVDAARAPLEAPAGDILIRSWFPEPHGEAARIALDRATAAAAVYSALFGPLSYPIVDIVEAPLQRAAGVECTGLFFVAAANAATPQDPFFDVIVSHEMAHQWFYAAVGNDPTEDPWLDEALATYASNVFLAVGVSDAAARAERSAWETAYGRARQAYPDLRVTSPLYEFPDSGTYASFAYVGGALELDALRQRLGDDAFFAALAEYVSSNLGAIATPLDLCACFQRAHRGPVDSVLCGSDAPPTP